MKTLSTFAKIGLLIFVFTLLVVEYNKANQMPPEQSALKQKQEIFSDYEQMASFNGDAGEWIQQHLRYPKLALENKIGGRIITQLVIDTTGNVGDVSIVRSSWSFIDKYDMAFVLAQKISQELDSEAVRVVKSMPKWNPAYSYWQHKHPIRTRWTMPVNFKLPEKQ